MNKQELLTDFENLVTKDLNLTNCNNCTGCTSCYNCTNCTGCTNCTYCTNCNACYNCNNCINCTYCILCKGLTDKTEGYWLLNKQVTQDTYLTALLALKEGE